jgi:hypothetical protein
MSNLEPETNIVSTHAIKDPRFDTANNKYDELIELDYKEVNRPPVLTKKVNTTEENIFLESLAKMHNTDKKNIVVCVVDNYKIYTINGKQIFKDTC